MSQEKVFATAASLFALQLFGWFAWLNIFNIEAMVKHGEVQSMEVAQYAIRVNAEIATFSLVVSMIFFVGILVQTFVVPWVQDRFAPKEESDGSTDDTARETATQP